MPICHRCRKFLTENEFFLCIECEKEDFYQEPIEIKENSKNIID